MCTPVYTSFWQNLNLRLPRYHTPAHAHSKEQAAPACEEGRGGRTLDIAIDNADLSAAHAPSAAAPSKLQREKE
eukprot:1859964-Rhodomonas_salina.1